MLSTSNVPAVTRTARRDLIILVAFCIAATAAVFFFNTAEMVISVLERAEDWQLDELMLLPVWFALPVAIFTLRRWQEARREFASRVRAEAVLREHAELLDLARDTIVVRDLDGRITFWNRGAERTFGWTSEDAVGRVLDEVLRTEYECSAGALESAIAAAGHWEGELVHTTRDGTQVAMSSRQVVRRGAGGEPVAILEIDNDVTDRKMMEDELRRARDAALESARIKSEFLANMSHEIRTPMNGIIGMTELALDTELDRNQREFLELVKSSGNSLLSIINDILDFSKIEAGKLSIEPIDFLMRDCVGDLVVPLALRAQDKGPELMYRIAPDVPDALVGDPGRLRQVLVNLIGNAIKFTEHGEVSVDVTVVSSDDDGTTLRFAIADTGIGIRVDKLASIFSPFSQADGSTTRKYGGTGLGLAISAQIVELMGGSIAVKSEVGVGSTFEFTVRFGISSAELTEAGPHAAVDLAGVRTLIADDNATNRRILYEVTSGWAMDSSLARGGLEAIEKMKRAVRVDEPYQLVLLDAVMPDMGGFEVVEEIRRRPELAGATIMMLSSGDYQADLSRCRKLGIAHYLVKPVSQSSLLVSIRAALGLREAPARPAASAATRPAARTLRVLVAEDNHVNQRYITSLLEKLGHTVVLAGTGAEAVACYEHDEFDLVLMDIQMPVMDGIEAATRIREREVADGRRTPIVALTAHALESDQARCLAAGMDDYVAKPVRPDALVAVIDRTCPGVGQAVSSGREQSAANGDGAAIAEHLGVDGDFVEELAGLTRVAAGDLVRALGEALAADDDSALARHAHSLKGMLSLFGPSHALEAVEHLEHNTERADHDEMAAAVGVVAVTVGQFLATLDAGAGA